MSDFVLIDLQSQQASVSQYIADWTLTQILEWMQCYGTVYKVKLYEEQGLTIYVLRSFTGIYSLLRFYPDEQVNIPACVRGNEMYLFLRPYLGKPIK